MSDLPLHGKSYVRPADRMMSEQSAIVASRRAPLERMAMAPEHVEHLPRAESAPEPLSASPAPGLTFDSERPTPDYELPGLPAPAKKDAPK